MGPEGGHDFFKDTELGRAARPEERPRSAQDDILEALDAGEIKPGNRGEMTQLENGDWYRIDPETSRISYVFSDNYLLEGEIINGRLENANVLDGERKPLHRWDDRRTIETRVAAVAQTVETRLH